MGIDRVTSIMGWLFIIAAVAIAAKPGGIAASYISDLRLEKRRASTMRAGWSEVSSSSRSTLGSREAESRLVTFVDYNCYYCRLLHDSMRVLHQEYPSASVRIRQLPNPSREGSRRASLAAICADAQGHFDQMHDFLLSEHEWQRTTDWTQVAEQVGVPDPVALEECLDSEEAEKVLAADAAWGERLELRATPATLVDRERVVFGVVDVSSMAEWLELVQ